MPREERRHSTTQYPELLCLFLVVQAYPDRGVASFLFNMSVLTDSKKGHLTQNNDVSCLIVETPLTHSPVTLVQHLQTCMEQTSDDTDSTHRLLCQSRYLWLHDCCRKSGRNEKTLWGKLRSDLIRVS